MSLNRIFSYLELKIELFAPGELTPGTSLGRLGWELYLRPIGRLDIRVIIWSYRISIIEFPFGRSIARQNAPHFAKKYHIVKNIPGLYFSTWITT